MGEDVRTDLVDEGREAGIDVPLVPAVELRLHHQRVEFVGVRKGRHDPLAGVLRVAQVRPGRRGGPTLLLEVLRVVQILSGSATSPMPVALFPDAIAVS